MKGSDCKGKDCNGTEKNGRKDEYNSVQFQIGAIKYGDRGGRIGEWSTGSVAQSIGRIGQVSGDRCKRQMWRRNKAEHLFRPFNCKISTFPNRNVSRSQRFQLQHLQLSTSSNLKVSKSQHIEEIKETVRTNLSTDAGDKNRRFSVDSQEGNREKQCFWMFQSECLRVWNTHTLLSAWQEVLGDYSRRLLENGSDIADLQKLVWCFRTFRWIIVQSIAERLRASHNVSQCLTMSHTAFRLISQHLIASNSIPPDAPKRTIKPPLNFEPFQDANSSGH